MNQSKTPRGRRGVFRFKAKRLICRQQLLAVLLGRRLVPIFLIIEVEFQKLAAVGASRLAFLKHIGIDAYDIAAGRAADLINVAVCAVLVVTVAAAVIAAAVVVIKLVKILLE